MRIEQSLPKRHLPWLVGNIAITLLVVAAGNAYAQRIDGFEGASSQWGSGWLDLRVPMDFDKGDKLEIQLGGSAEKVIVRLLSRGVAPDAPSGIVGGTIAVPKSRHIVLSLPHSIKQVVQISVHGGPNPWGNFPLGAGNGPATIVAIERVKQ